MPFRRMGLAVGAAVVIAACGGTAMSLSDYVDVLNEVGSRASRQGAELAAQVAQVTDFTPQDLVELLEQSGEIRTEVQESVDAITPPSEIAALHDEIFDWHERFIVVEEDLAELAASKEDTDADWTALSDSPQMGAYRSALAEGKQLCENFQARLDATASRGAFSDVPWLPSRMTEVVEAVLGCAWFPEEPENVYRWPPP